MKKNYFMKVVLMLSCFITSVAWAQERSVSGKVIGNEDGTPIPGVSVVIKGTTNGTTTDADGRYKLNVPGSGGTLVFSFIGLKTEEISIGERSVVDIGLTLDVTQLSEVVVVGYGTQTRENFIGNAASVKGGAIATNPNQSFDASLGGRAAGVQVTIPNGVLNNPPVFRIRGTNSINLSSYPLIVVDGVPTFTGDVSGSLAAANALGNINPADIESMEILKDAAATAIYGSRAANGVVVISTKKGKKGKAKVTYDGWVGWTKAYRMWDMLNAEQYLTIKNEGLSNIGREPRYVDNKDANGNSIDTDWAGILFRTGFSQSHTVSVQGGSDATSYFFSAGTTGQEGMIVGNGYNRKSVRFSVDQKANNWFSMGINANYANELNEAVVNSGSLSGQAYNTAGIGRLALILPPNLAPYNNDGSYNLNGAVIGSMGNVEVITGYYNPMPIIDHNFSNTENNHVQGNVYMQAAPIKGLSIKTLYGLDYLVTDDQSFNTPLGGDGYSSTGTASSSTYKQYRSVWTTTAQYDKVFADKHSVNILVGTEQQRTTTEGFGLSRSNVSDPYYEVIQGGWVTNNTAGLTLGENYLWSGFGRLDYNFNKKYFVGASFRRDGYSAFAAGKKYGNFYSVSGGWDVAKESFWTFGEQVNSLRLRGSYGTVGNIGGIGNFASNSFYGNGYYNGVATLVFNQAGNSSLTWETSKKLDVGVTVGVFNDRITGEVAWYKNNIDGLLLNVPQAPSAGMPNNPLANIGSMYNQGVEVTLSATPVDKGKFTWNTSVNFSTNKNQVVSLAPGVDYITASTSGSETASITQPGKPVGYLWVVRTDGVNPENGRRIFVNKNGEKVQYNPDPALANAARWTYLDGSPAPIVAAGVDNVPYKNTNPKWYGGWDNTLKYGNFDLNLLFTYQGGFYVYNGTRASTLDQRFWNSSTDILRRWQNPGDVTDIPRVVYGDNTSNGSAIPISANVQKGDFVKLRNISLGYKIPSSLYSKAGISNVRVYGSAQNLFVITGYEGPDPEVSANGNGNLNQGIDRNTVPNARTFTLGVSLGF